MGPRSFQRLIQILLILLLGSPTAPRRVSLLKRTAGVSGFRKLLVREIVSELYCALVLCGSVSATAVQKRAKPENTKAP